MNRGSAMIAEREIAIFENHKYLNLETFRRSGAGVQTPVWFVEANGRLYVRTIAGSGKVKRIWNNGRARVAPCDVRGGLYGEWINARARMLCEDEIQQIEEINRMLNKKYGLLKSAFDMASRFQKHKSATIEIELAE
jgi:uncharacterized protein